MDTLTMYAAPGSPTAAPPHPERPATSEAPTARLHFERPQQKLSAAIGSLERTAAMMAAFDEPIVVELPEEPVAELEPEVVAEQSGVVDSWETDLAADVELVERAWQTDVVVEPVAEAEVADDGWQTEPITDPVVDAAWESVVATDVVDSWHADPILGHADEDVWQTATFVDSEPDVEPEPVAEARTVEPEVEHEPVAEIEPEPVVELEPEPVAEVPAEPVVAEAPPVEPAAEPAPAEDRWEPVPGSPAVAAAAAEAAAAEAVAVAEVVEESETTTDEVPEPEPVPYEPAAAVVGHELVSDVRPSASAPAPVAEWFAQAAVAAAVEDWVQENVPLEELEFAARRIVVRLSTGETVDVSGAANATEANEAAKEVVRYIGEAEAAGEWPELGRRFIRPDAIVSVDVQVAG